MIKKGKEGDKVDKILEKATYVSVGLLVGLAIATLYILPMEAKQQIIIDKSIEFVDHYCVDHSLTTTYQDAMNAFAKNSSIDLNYALYGQNGTKR